MELDAPPLLVLVMVEVKLLGALVSVDAKMSSIRKERGLGRSSCPSWLMVHGVDG
jgi:hypothetical protein